MHESVAGIEPTISEVKGACSGDCATEAPKTFHILRPKAKLDCSSSSDECNYKNTIVFSLFVLYKNIPQ